MATIDLTRITAAKTAASLATHTNQLAADIAAIPTAEQSSKVYNLPLVCSRTGLTVGNLSITAVAGHYPMIGQWKNSMVLHPIFSMDDGALLKFARNAWFRFCAFSDDEALDDSLTTKQETLLRVAALAMLHKLTDFKQDVVWLPSWAEVSKNWNSLLALSYWKNYLESERFKFPSLRVSKYESVVHIGDFLQVCWQVKKDYETKVNEKIEKAKLQAAERAILALRSDIAGKTPRSAKVLWRWFIANLPSRYANDIEGWMHKVYWKDTDWLISEEYTLADIDLFEQIFLAECPVGNSLSHAFLDILRAKRKQLESHYSTFEILVPDIIQEQKASGEIAEEEPRAENYKSKALFMIAQAKWRLAYQTKDNSAASAKKQATVTVKPTFVPGLPYERKTKLEQAVEDSEPDEAPW